MNLKKSNKLQNRMQTGGKYLFHGSYGCAYKPAMKCKGAKKRVHDSISKIMNRAEAEKEMKKGALLKPVDPTQKFFLWPTTICSVRPEDLTPENNLKNCPLVDHQFNSNLTDAALVVYGDGGIDLAHLILNAKQYKAFFKSIAQLFEGLVLLHSNSIVHLDIKPSNLVARQTSESQFHLRYIDFGFTTEIQNYERAGIPNVDYKYWPYEYRFAKRFFQKANITPKSVDAFRDKLNSYAELAGLEPIDQLVETKNYETFLSFGERLETRIVPLLKAVDVYSLGVALFELYYNRFGHFISAVYSPLDFDIDVVDSIEYGTAEVKTLHFFLVQEISLPFFSLLLKMTTIHLDERITAEQAYTEFLSIVPKFDVLEPFLVTGALKTVNKPAATPPPPTPPREPTELNAIRSNLFVGGSKKKTQRKRR